VLLVRGRGSGELSFAQDKSLRINGRDLVMQVVMGEIANPVGRTNPYRIGNDGVPRILPGPGGIVLNRRIGDHCVGLAGDHVEPGVALRNHERGSSGAPDGPNLALMTSACIGNLARVVTGPCRGAKGIVTGKHGGVDHVLVDFDTRTLCNLNIGDHVQVYSCGLGPQLIDFPEISLSNCSPGLLRRWNPAPRGGVLEVRVTNLLPAAIIGSGLGLNTVWRGDFDIELFDPQVRRHFRLEQLRFGDLVCVRGGDSRFGISWRSGRTTIGVIAHSDSTASGHGPGIVALMTGPASQIRPIFDNNANIAALYERRLLARPFRRTPIAGRSQARAGMQPSVRRGLHLDTRMRVRHHATNS
jgi:Domain of unknown function (DUF4438)